MAQRLPIPGSDNGTWGSILNGFLEVSHNADGSLQTTALTTAGAVTSVNNSTPTNGNVTLTASSLGAAPLASPAFTGTPTAPTATAGTNTTQLATTAFTTTAIGGLSGQYVPFTNGSVEEPIIDAGGEVFDIRAYGAVSSSTADNSAAIQAAITAARAAVGGPNNSPGSVVYIPSGTWLCNITIRSGVYLIGAGISTVLRPYNQTLPCISSPLDVAFIWGGIKNLQLYGYGIGTRVTPYTPITGQGGTPSGRVYNLPLVLATAISNGATITSITVNAISATNTMAAGTGIIINLDGAGQVATVATTTTLSTTGTTTIPINSLTASATYATNTPLMVSGGFAHAIFIGMGYGSSAGAISGMNHCVFENIYIQNFGNNGLHIEGGSVYQTHQFCRFADIFVQYCDCGYYLFGEIQACLFENCDTQIATWYGWAIVAYLEMGTTWNVANENKFLRCLSNLSGSYLSGNSVVNVTTTTYGLYNEGGSNNFDTFYFEQNGLGDTTYRSTGVRNYYIASGQAGNVYTGCEFASHFIDYWDNRGNGNVVEWCKWSYNGSIPPSAHKTSFLQLDGNSGNGYCDSPVVGPQANIGSGVLFIYSGATFAAGLNPIISYAKGGSLMNPWPTGTVFTAGSYVSFGSGPLSTGVLSDVVLNTAPAANAPSGWTCTTAGTPGTWQVFGNAQPSAWITVTTFTNSWVSVGGSSAAVAYRLTNDGQHVELAGVLGSGTASNAAFTLPAGFRPITQKTLSSYSTGTGGGRYIQVTTSGVVTPEPSGATAPFSLDGIIFPLDI